MPPKPVDAKGKKKKPEGPTAQEYVDAIKLGVVTTAEGKVIRRAESLLTIWTKALQRDDQQPAGQGPGEEFFKAACGPPLIKLAVDGTIEEKHAALGAIAALCKNEKHYAEVVNSKVSKRHLQRTVRAC